MNNLYELPMNYRCDKVQGINENSSKFEKMKHYIDIEDKITKEQLKAADMILNELSLEEVQEFAEVLLNGPIGGL